MIFVASLFPALAFAAPDVPEPISNEPGLSAPQPRSLEPPGPTLALRRWTAARRLRIAGLGFTGVGFVMSGYGLASLPRCTEGDGCLGLIVVTFGGLAVAVPGVALATIGQVGQDRLLRGVARRKWPGQLGALALVAGVATSSLLFAAIAWDGDLVVIAASTGAIGVGTAFETAQIVLDDAQVYSDGPTWTLAPRPGGLGVACLW